MSKKDSELGLKRGTVTIVPYDLWWPEEFEREKRALIAKFGNNILAVEHIGSTAITGLPSKPIIDINVAIPSLKDAEAFVELLQEMGYEYMKDRWFEDRYFFPKGPGSNRTHHLNLVEITSENAWLSKIWFRDYLISHPTEREAYAKLKDELSQKYADDRESYTEAKSKFVQDITQKAKGFYG